MKIMRLAGLLPVLMLAGCQSTGLPNASAKSDVPTEWEFNFFTPRALPALVTFAVVQDADGTVYRFNTLNSTPDLPDVIGTWNNKDRAPGGHWNHVERPPRHIIFCWDSVIDKKVYETHLTIPKPVLEKMLKPSVNKDYQGNTAYYKNVQIGLAPEGKITVWLQGIGFEPNYRVIPSVLYTLSGDKLGICKGVTRHPNGYKYYGDTPEFIKGKKYPYGNW
ncbi:DUF2931 family protein [Serratia proteamaculans]